MRLSTCFVKTRPTSTELAEPAILLRTVINHEYSMSHIVLPKTVDALSLLPNPEDCVSHPSYKDRPWMFVGAADSNVTVSPTHLVSDKCFTYQKNTVHTSDFAPLVRQKIEALIRCYDPLLYQELAEQERVENAKCEALIESTFELLKGLRANAQYANWKEVQMFGSPTEDLPAADDKLLALVREKVQNGRQDQDPSQSMAIPLNRRGLWLCLNMRFDISGELTTDLRLTGQFWQEFKEFCMNATPVIQGINNPPAQTV